MICLICLRRNPPRPIPEVLKLIRKAPAFQMVTLDIWLIASGLTIETWTNRIAAKLGPNDTFLIMRTMAAWGGQVPGEVDEWLHGAESNGGFDAE